MLEIVALICSFNSTSSINTGRPLLFNTICSFVIGDVVLPAKIVVSKKANAGADVVLKSLKKVSIHSLG